MKRPSRVVPAAGRWAFVLLLASFSFGCRRQDTPALPPTPEGLRLVRLPGLDALDPSVQAQLRDAYARLQAFGGSASAASGAAYGEMGRLLLLYDLDATAEAALLNAAALLPKTFHWPYYLGYLYQKTNRFEEAVGWYTRALDLQPDYVPAHVHLAEVLQDLERFAEARRHAEQAVRLDPDCAAAYFLLGQLTAHAEPARAVTHYQQVLRLQPRASIVHHPLGMAYRNAGDAQRSRTYLARSGEGKILLHDPLIDAMERKKRGVDALLFQGSKLMQRRAFGEAAALFEKAVAEDSTSVSGYLNLGAAYLEIGRRQEARAALENALRFDPANSKAHFNLGTIYDEQGERAPALEHYRTAVATDPENTKAHFGLSRLLWLGGRCQEAIPHFERFLAAVPDHVESRIHQAICHVQLGAFAEARAVLEAGYEADPKHPGLQDALARVLSASDDAAVRDGPRAVELGERLVQALPRPETLETLAMAYAEVGRFADAVARQQQALQVARQHALDGMLGPMTEMLRRYEQGQPCRTPWSPAIFDRK